jgi:hypothetical protein
MGNSESMIAVRYYSSACSKNYRNRNILNKRHVSTELLSGRMIKTFVQTRSISTHKNMNVGTDMQNKIKVYVHELLTKKWC